MLTQSRLRELLDYDPSTGVFRWRAFASDYCRRVKIGDVAGGAVAPTGYKAVRVDKRDYYQHRLAWLYVYGSFPPKGRYIDHINCVKTDNRIENLRVVSQSEQNANSTRFNKTGFNGIHKNKRRWYAAIHKNGKKYKLGSFDSPEKASMAYRMAGYRLYGDRFKDAVYASQNP